MKNVDAVILAGGKGTRLGSLTKEIQKPLVPVAGKPIIEYVLKKIASSGIVNVRMCVNHKADMIENALGSGAAFGLNISYHHENEPLSTVGPIKLLDNLSDHFIVANGDILTDLDILQLYQYHMQSGSLLTVATHKRPTKIDYGVLESDANGIVTGFREKPVYDFSVSMGIYVFSRDVLDMVPQGRPYGFDNLMIDLLKKGQAVSSFCFDGYWLDIGRPDDLAQAEQDKS